MSLRRVFDLFFLTGAIGIFKPNLIRSCELINTIRAFKNQTIVIDLNSNKYTFSKQIDQESPGHSVLEENVIRENKSKRDLKVQLVNELFTNFTYFLAY